MRCWVLYQAAIIDVYRRFIVGWQLLNILNKETQTYFVREDVRRHGKPVIINSGQGSQYTCEHWLSTKMELGIQICLDGKGRATDNALIERF
jgi:putative transposase